MNAAENAAANQVTVYTVTFSREADQSLLQRVAEAGNGKHYHASTRNELITAFKDIATRLPTLITE